MFESLLQIVLGDHLGGYTFEPPHGRAGLRAHAGARPPPLRDSDGYVCVLIYNDKQWRAFFELIGKPEMFARPAIRDARKRAARTTTRAYAMVADEMKTRSTA